MKKFKRREKLTRTLLSLANWVAPKSTGEYLAKSLLIPKKYERPLWEKNLLQKAQKVHLPSGRNVWKWGESGPQVLLVHGWEGRGTQLGAFIEPLLEAGNQVFAWDGPAHGDSPGESTHLLEFSKALKEDLEYLATIESVIAHSMGAASLLLAMEDGIKVKKAILIASPTQWASAVYSLAARLKLRDATLKAMLKSLEERVGKPIESFNIQDSSLKEKISLFILHDEKDDAVPLSEFTKLQKVFPEAKGKLYSGLGHRRILKDAGVILEVVKFIKEAA